MTEKFDRFNRESATNIRVHFDTSDLDREEVTNEQRIYLRDKLIPTCKSFYEKRLLVNRRFEHWEEVNGQQCGETVLPNNIENLDTDVFIKVTGQNAGEEEEWGAWSTACFKS